MSHVESMEGTQPLTAVNLGTIDQILALEIKYVARDPWIQARAATQTGRWRHAGLSSGAGGVARGSGPGPPRLGRVTGRPGR